MKINFKKIIEIISMILLLSFFIFFIILLIEGSIIRKELRLNGKASVGKFILQERYKKGYTKYFIIDINGVKYKGTAIANNENDSEKIGKFYRIHYSEKFKGSLNVNLNQEVTDTFEILHSGFTMDQILGKVQMKLKERSFKDEMSVILGIESNN